MMTTRPTGVQAEEQPCKIFPFKLPVRPSTREKVRIHVACVLKVPPQHVTPTVGGRNIEDLWRRKGCLAKALT